MARKSKGQEAALAGTTQDVSGQVRVDASNRTEGGKSVRSTTSLQPSLPSATQHLEEQGQQAGEITSPSGVNVRVSRSKGGASASSEYSLRSSEFGDKNAPPVRRGVSGAASGEARWNVSQQRGENAVARSVEQANAVRASDDPITKHGTLSVVRGLAKAGADKGKVARATGAIARRDPSAALALQGSVERAGAISRADTRVRRTRQRAAGAPSQEINTWSPNATQSTTDIRARSRQGFVHTQQAGADISHETRMLGLEHKLSRKESEDPSLSAEQRSGARATMGAATRLVPQLQARNRAAMTVNRRPMEEVVGTQPADVRSAQPPGTSARTGRNPKAGTGHGY